MTEPSNWRHDSVFDERSATASEHRIAAERWRDIAEGALQAGDTALASEAWWGAVSQLIQAVAKRNGLPSNNHADLRQTASWIGAEIENPELPVWYNRTFALHRNFYRIVLTHDEVEDRSTYAAALLDSATKFA